MAGQAIIAPGLRGIQWIYGGIDWEFFDVLRPGDIISQRGHLEDAIEKRGKTVPRMVLQIGRLHCARQDGVEVARSRVYHMRTPRRQAPGGMDYRVEQRPWSPEELAAIEEETLIDHVRGAAPRYWEEVEEEEVLPTAAYGPLRVSEISLTGCYTDAGAISGEGVAHSGGHVYQLLNRRRHPADTYLDPETGVQDHPHRGHWESFMAREVGMPGVYDMGPHRVSWFSRYITDWMGDNAFLVRLSAQLRRPNIVGDVTRIPRPGSPEVGGRWLPSGGLRSLGGEPAPGNHHAGPGRGLPAHRPPTRRSAAHTSGHARRAIRRQGRRLMTGLSASTESTGRGGEIAAADLREAESLIGILLRRPGHNRTVTRPAISRWARSIGDRDPLWLDADYGPNSSAGATLAPPCWLYSVDDTCLAVKFPGLHVLYGGTDWTFSRPVALGDCIESEARITDIEEKSGRFCGPMILQTGETVFRNHSGDEVARAVSRVFRTRREAAVNAGKYRGIVKAPLAVDQMVAIENAYDGEQIRGPEPRYWGEPTHRRPVDSNRPGAADFGGSRAVRGGDPPQPGVRPVHPPPPPTPRRGLLQDPETGVLGKLGSLAGAGTRWPKPSVSLSPTTRASTASPGLAT